MIPRHWPLLQISPQPQAGVQVFPGQSPALHVPPPAQPHVPPHPSLWPQVPSLGQYGSQQALWYDVSPVGQAQVLPQPSDMPARLPSDGQFGWQQLPL